MTYDTPIIGGDVALQNNTILKYAVIGILVLLILYIIYRIFIQYTSINEDSNQRQTREHFNQLHGDAYDETAKQTIAFGENIQNPRAIDHYRIGTTYLVNANNPQMAHRHFQQALQQVIDGKVDVTEAPFILDHIDDYKDHFIDFPDIADLQLQQALLAHFDMKTDIINSVANQKKGAMLDENDPDFTQKLILSRQNWQSDSQNVHDSSIYDDLKKQFALVKYENLLIPNINTKDFNDVSNWLKVRYQNDKDKLSKINKVLSFYNHNYTIGAMPDVHEQDLLVAVWQRAYDPGNKDNFNAIRDAIGDSILDCVEGGHVVCMAGRNTKTWQALAKLDKNPIIGVLKSKQLIRNEIYELSAKIVDDYIGTNGSVSQDLKSAYLNGENTEQVNELIECMKRQIDKLREKYNTSLSTEQLDLIIRECQASI